MFVQCCSNDFAALNTQIKCIQMLARQFMSDLDLPFANTSSVPLAFRSAASRCSLPDLKSVQFAVIVRPEVRQHLRLVWVINRQ